MSTLADPVAVANAIKAVAAGVSGVVSATLGKNMLTATPAAEVWLDRGSLMQEPAGGQPVHREVHELIVAFYVPLTENLESDEAAIGALLHGFVSDLHDPAFDYTLGGLVENARATAWAFDVMARNGFQYRVGTLTVQAGDL